jgi:hypothetical protein
VNEAGGGGSHTGNHGAVGKVAVREAGFYFLGCFGNLGEQKLSKCLIIHIYYLFFKILYDTIPFPCSKVNKSKFNLPFLSSYDILPTECKGGL